MKKLSRKSLKVIKYVIISIVIVVTLLLLMFNSGVAFLETVSGFVINPVVSVVDSTAQGIGNFFGGFSSRAGLKDELNKVRAELAQLENIKSVADEVKAENERLLALFNESEKYPEFKYEYARVIARSVDDYSATFTLNKGTNDGIKENMVVVAPGGLAGKIIKTTENTSILLAIIDGRCGVPSLSESSRDMGVVKGVSESGTTAGYCVMTELPTNAIIKPGDAVITSGMGEVYPKGIVVGTITEVSQGTANNINSSAKLTPAVDFDHLESVLIIISAEAE
ncbi:MAG: rod shape-determining protein MreC [Clostridia bacterium]|nr:rod shape-determining protein MreC [Clostridia bacterium]